MNPSTLNTPQSAERIQVILNDLIRQRQSMRDAMAESGLLEANRLSIVYWQLQLTRCRANERRERATGSNRV